MLEIIKNKTFTIRNVSNIAWDTIPLALLAVGDSVKLPAGFGKEGAIRVGVVSRGKKLGVKLSVRKSDGDLYVVRVS
jgi:hypothetical protein